MNFTIFVLGFILLATPQYSFGQLNAPEAERLIKDVNKSLGLDPGNTRFINSFQQTVNKVVSQGVSTVLDKTGATSVINNMVIPIPINLNNTSIGKLFNHASNGFSSAVGHIDDLTLALNEYFNNLIDKADNFTTTKIFRPNSDTNSCRSIPSDFLPPNFTEALFKGSKSCFNSVTNMIQKHSLVISELQKELNNALQIGKLRVALLFDIKREITNLQTEIADARRENPKCDLSLGITTQHMKRLFSNWVFRCLLAIFDKVLD